MARRQQRPPRILNLCTLEDGTHVIGDSEYWMPIGASLTVDYEVWSAEPPEGAREWSNDEVRGSHTWAEVTRSPEFPFRVVAQVDVDEVDVAPELIMYLRSGRKSKSWV